MPRKHFVADLERLSRPGAVGSCISGLKRGDDDGTFTFEFKGKIAGVKGVEVAGAVPELSDYPSAHQILIYTTSADAPVYASKALEKLSLDSLDLEKAIKKISDKLQKALAADEGEFEDFDDYDDSDDGSIGGWSDDEVCLDASGDSQMTDSLGPMGNETRSRLWRVLRNDLRQSKAAGFKIGVMGDYKGGMDFHISLGIRVAKLGISDEAMAAWKLDRTKYFIVLIHYSNYYQNLIRLLGGAGEYHAKKDVKMCVGTATRYKPTFQEAITAFSKVSLIAESQGQQHISGIGDLETSLDSRTEKDGPRGFKGIFISSPLNQLLNSALVQLLKYRLRYGFGWDGAELYYNTNQGKQTGGIETIKDNYYEVHQPKNALTPIVMADALSGSTDGFTVPFPLLAMQFALRHLVRCTEFCLVCYKKVDADFEALKPYVCSNPLCLYQYMSLGFGPSIEYEIVSQPSVVDLLVSFCYTSAELGKLKDFPVGMDLVVYSSTSLTWRAQYHRFKGELLFDDTMNDTRVPLKEGDWVVITVPGNLTEEWHARITEHCYYPAMKITPPISTHSSSKLLNGTYVSDSKMRGSGNETPDNSGSFGIIPGNTDIRDVNFKIYDASFDELSEDEKRSSIVNLLNTIPSVTEMKIQLQKNTSVGDEASLRKWKSRISPSALGVLRWIIASNRSCIVPLGDDEDNKSCEFQPVRGMGDWKQFRFAMGAPDKEQRFVNSLKDAQLRLKLTYPSLFAFHGSPLANWHSIIREGLNFKRTAHGRAYGHGCYHSLDLATSLGYTEMSAFQSTGWPQSDLKITGALSLNEIVNAPNEFVSKNPHLVVAQLDWIQTRYLFLQTPKPNPGTPGKSGSVVKKKKRKLEPGVFQPQDPAFTPRNFGTTLKIPATPSSRRRLPTVENGDIEMHDAPSMFYETMAVQLARRGVKALKNGASEEITPGISAHNSVTVGDEALRDDVSVATDVEDCIALLSDEEEGEEVATQLVAKGKGKVVPDRLDAFIPGSLDTFQIQFLEPPAYASLMASKRLNSDLQSLIKLQESQPLSEIGFYINPDHIDNVYQWIVEMHSFPETLPLVQDMRAKSPVLRSIVLEIRFGPQYPMSPPFVRVVKPRFLGFHQGGGGNVTLGGAMCMELLTNTGWSAVSTAESVLMQVRMALMDEERPARLESGKVLCYSVGEAVNAFKRACRNHGWKEPEGIDTFLK